MRWIILFSTLLCVGLPINADGSVSVEEEILEQLLENGYNPTIKPDNNPTNVTVNMYMRDFRKIDLFEGSMATQVTFRQQWNDPRLRYDDRSSSIQFVTVTNKEKVWTPDTFFRNELEAKSHDVLVPNEYVRIFPNGDVLYSIRLSLKTICYFDLHLFPFDKQTCEMQMASYAWSADDIVYSWKLSSPVQINRVNGLPDYMLMNFTTENCDVVTTTGRYSCLSVSFEVQREPSPIVLTYYMPTIMVAIMAGLAGFISIPNMGIRILIICLCLLFIVAMSMIVSYVHVTRHAYTMAINVWFETNITLIFLLLVESIVMAWGCKSAKVEGCFGGNSFKEMFTSGPMSVKVDFVCRLLYFIVLVIYYIAYFATYTDQ